MRTMRFFRFLSFFFLLLIIACGSVDNSDDEFFDYKLRGVWKTHQNDNECEGSLVIDIDTIIIDYTYYSVLGDQRPFESFTHKIPLKGYSEEYVPPMVGITGELFIDDPGKVVQDVIPYFYYTGGQEQFLKFEFGGRIEILRRTGDVMP